MSSFGQGKDIELGNNAVTNTMCYIIDYISPVSAVAAQKFYDSKFAYPVCSIFCSLCLLLGYVNQEKSSFAPDLRSLATRECLADVDNQRYLRYFRFKHCAAFPEN